MTVALLVQIDKLVQLIESPVFTCEFHRNIPCNVRLTCGSVCRPKTPTSRAGEISVPFQVFVRPADVTATKFSVRLSKKQTQRSQLLWLLAYRTKIVVRSTFFTTQASDQFFDIGPWGIFPPLDRNWVGKTSSGKNSSSTSVPSRPNTKKQGDKT